MKQYGFLSEEIYFNYDTRRLAIYIPHYLPWPKQPHQHCCNSLHIVIKLLILQHT